ncbi:MAG: alpha/beta hydrolase, partial [Flavisolibacter sp.]
MIKLNRTGQQSGFTTIMTGFEVYAVKLRMQWRQKLAISYIRTKFRLLAAVSKKKAAEKAFRFFCTPRHRNTKKPSPVFAKAEKLQFRYHLQTVRGYRWNKGGEKKLLIAHGFESAVVNFDRYIKPSIAKGYEVITFDAPAHGQSTGTTINAREYKEVLQAIYRQYGPIDAFITHSFGGLCLSLALEELGTHAAQKLVFIAPAVETTTAIDHFFALLRLDAGVRKEFDRLITDIGGHPPSWYSVARTAPLLKAQVLFLQDKDDLMTPYSDVEPIIRKNYPNFHFVITEGLG